MKPVKRVAVIGAGPAGAITVDALVREKIFDRIRVFERREGPGGCWIDDNQPSPLINLTSLASEETANPPLPIPSTLPVYTPRSLQPRYAESSVYPYLETNVVDLAMQFSDEPIPAERSAQSIAVHGEDTPFRHWTVIRRYISDLFTRKGYNDLVSYNTSVELVEKIGDEWKVTLRREEGEKDYWWVEWFDAVVVAAGRYSVPYIPAIPGLEEWQTARPGSVLHSKQYRGREQFKGKNVVVVGASVSAADIAFDLAHNRTALLPVHTITLGRTANLYFGLDAFDHPSITQHPSIATIDPPSSPDGKATVHLSDGTSIPDVDNIILGTGYTWSLPFLPSVDITRHRIRGLYQHVVYRSDSTLLFVGAVGTGLTFKIFEWQAVLAARVLAGRVELPSTAEMKEWEDERVRRKGDGAAFSIVFPDFEDYFEEVRKLAGDGEEGVGRKLPAFRREWVEAFMEGHERRKRMWRRLNEEARRDMGR
ncbi:hypothetical protein QBC47DRAFT_417586 [Echria macrotheca]|uniref:FAD/NAD(P)-binding domain-containing protein n=1 Tax=Echria macrotheca TaxID=438768 RepID=A0AAJ0B3V1_9PEZI|nr:hypothetical protein QBC47DRAFT_417586 [Echria macrotheca]